MNQMQQQRRFYIENLHEDYRLKILSDQEKMDKMVEEKHSNFKSMEVDS